MYFWNTKQLAEDIKDNQVDEKDKMYYYLITLVFWNLSIFLTGGSTDEIYASSIIEAILVSAVAIIGTLITFSTNKGSHGVDYISRVIMLSIPLSIKVVIFFFLFFVIDGGDSMSMIPMMNLIAEILVYWRINLYLKYIN